MDAEQIRQRLRSKKTQERIQAVEQTARMGSSERQALLLEALADSTSYIAARAAEALGEGADGRAALTMTERFVSLCEDGSRRDPGCAIRANLAFALGRLQYYPAADVLRAGIRTVQMEAVGGVPTDTAGHLRGNCALALAHLRGPDAVRDIALLLYDWGRQPIIGVRRDPLPTMETRRAAARALALTGSAAARLPLTLRLVHPDNEAPEVLQECMQALVELEDPQALEVLEPYLRHADARLAAYAALMVAQTQSSEAAGLLGEAIGRLSGDPLQAAVLALATLRTPEAYALMHELARSEREQIRLAVIEALPSDEASRKLLADLAAGDPSPRVRTAAQSVLSGLL